MPKQIDLLSLLLNLYESKKNNMISFIGAGKVGIALGCYFKQKGFKISGYYSRTYKHAKHAAKLTDSDIYKNITELMNNSSMVWITTSDDALSVVAKEISELEIPQHIEVFIHTSGVHSTEVLQPIKDVGFSTYGAHPLMAFGKTDQSIIQLNNAYFALDQSTEASLSNDYLKIFFRKAGNNTLQINSKKKDLYHCAASVLSNYLVTLLNMAYEMFEESGMTKSDIKKATAPLLESTLKNIAENNQMSVALTGAIKRGDSTTVIKHIEALEKYMPNKKNLYKELGKETMVMLQDFRLKDILT